MFYIKKSNWRRQIDPWRCWYYKRINNIYSKKNSFEADDGHNDDLVMSLVLFAWLTRQSYFKQLTDMDVRVGIYEEEIEEIEENISPFGFINDGSDENGEWDGEDRWFSVWN